MAGMPERIAAGLEGRYLIEHELGQGGMATVWLARDLKLGRKVALKFFHVELARTLGPERFHREIRVTARLQHPHILALLDSGEVAGEGEQEPPSLDYVMPYVTGGSLRARLLRQDRLPVETAIRLAIEIADALAYAHREGLVHRDIKPENILLSEGHALVADFGVAMAVYRAEQDDAGAAPGKTAPVDAVDPTITSPGFVLGTPAYMSPEQALGEQGLDGRSDVYALGAVLYEMLTGERPFGNGPLESLVGRKLREPPPLVRSRRPEAPEVLDDVIARSLAAAPEARLAGAEHLARALEGALAATLRGAPATRPGPPGAAQSA
ncbi:MAG: serine/threonine-protein kinase [Gemmatimonadota bacterium]